MKPKETLLNIRLNGDKIELSDVLIDEMGDNHVAFSIETPLREDAFALDDDLKIELIEEKFRDIMNILGLDLTDDSLSGTPRRVAKMYVKEIFSGLNPSNKPQATLFENKYQYGEMLVEKNITFYSNCEHHFVPIIGKVHVAYISNGFIIGLSKINRIVQFYARRPQVQERLTIQIVNALKDVLKTTVYELAHYRNKHNAVIPSNVITKPPSAELAPNQTDQDSLPDYTTLDAIITAFVERKASSHEIIQLGYENELVNKIIKLIQKNEYKRQQSPPGIKITHCSFDKDWRYPITFQNNE